MSESGVFDAVVIGAGPAGAMSAKQIAASGRSVLLVDRGAFPRHKVCGCCLNLDALSTLASAGLERQLAALGGVPLKNLHLYCSKRSAVLPLPGGRSLSRYALDWALIEAAVAAGATFRAGVAARVVLAEGQLGFPQVRLSRDELVTARSIVAADGLGGTSLRDLPGFEPRVARLSRCGLGGVTSRPISSQTVPAGSIAMFIGRKGYLGAVSLEDGRIDFAAAVDPSLMKACKNPVDAVTQIAQEAKIDNRLPLEAVERWQLTPKLTRHRPRVAAPRVFVVGDAAGYVEPFTGEGMAWALASGHAVADAVSTAIDGRPLQAAAAWTAAQQRLIRRRQWNCRLAAGLLRRPRLTRAAVRVLAVTPQLARPAVRRISERSTGRPTGSLAVEGGARR